MSIVDMYVASPIYRVAHPFALLVVVTLVAVVGVGLWRARSSRPWAWLEPFVVLPLLERFFVGAVVAASASNLGMAVEHPDAAGLWLVVAAVAQMAVVRRVLRGRPWRGRAVAVLVVVLIVHMGMAVAGVTTDQVGLATALLQAGALAVVLRTVDGGRLRRLAASTVAVGSIGFVTLAAWVGAAVAGAEAERLGDTPPPGVLLPRGEDRPPTATEIAAAERLAEETAAAIAKYQDIEVAAAAGYEVDTIDGSQVHVDNPRFKEDGIILDPQRPETLVYEATPNGPVLLGALYQMEEIGVPGPAFGGPLTVWHAHDHLCVSLLPPGLAGFESPLGGCGLGAASLPITNEMLHVWTLPGVPQPFGELDEDWLAGYLAQYFDGD